MQPSPPPVEAITELPVLPPRAPDSHKGDFGRVLVVAGSRGMSGAAALAGQGALRGGAGLVFVAVPEDILPIIASVNPCYLTAPLPQDEHGRLAAAAGDPLRKLVAANDVTAMGPGLGQSPAISGLVLAVLKEAPGPLVLDADALNALQGQTQHLRGRPVPPVLTPHPGEFARLTGNPTPTDKTQREQQSVRFAAAHGVVLVLKGHVTLVTDGRQLYANTTGNPGMATGGSGDVLTGLIAALLGQGLKPFAAAQLGVYLHGLAGDLARDEVGEVSLIASDLLQYLPSAFHALRRASGAEPPTT
jgi:NAD(P)H-hydrate epimerase